MKMMHAGHGTYIPHGQIVAITPSDTKPHLRAIATADAANTLVNATAGHRHKALIWCANGAFVLSAINAEALAGRLEEPSP